MTYKRPISVIIFGIFLLSTCAYSLDDMLPNSLVPSSVKKKLKKYKNCDTIKNENRKEKCEKKLKEKASKETLNTLGFGSLFGGAAKK